MLSILLSRINQNIKNIILAGSSVLVGVIFAVFGQIYQTGANAYDFFLGWSVFITLWAVASMFPPLLLIWIFLLNITLFLYYEQVAREWTIVFTFTLMFILNILFLIAFILFSKFKIADIPKWFCHIIAIAAVFFSTMGICIGILDNNDSFFLLFMLTILVYGSGIKYGLENKSTFYMAIIPFSIMIMICSFLIEISHGEGMFFILTFFIIGSVTLIIKILINLQKKWK